MTSSEGLGESDGEPQPAEPTPALSPDPSLPPLYEPEPTPSTEPEAPAFEYVEDGWTRMKYDPKVKGWDVEGVVASYTAKWPSYLEALKGAKPLGIYHEAQIGDPIGNNDWAAHNTLMSYGYVLGLAAHERDRLSILDWGGGPGHYLPLSRALLPSVEIEYHSKDVPKLCRLGRELNPDATFWEDESCLHRKYDLVLASGSLQCSEDWAKTLGDLAKATGQFLYVTRLPIAADSQSFVVVQRPYSVGYDTEYLGWVISRRELLEKSSQVNLRLIREFLVQAQFAAAGAPEAVTDHRGFLFTPPS